MVSSSTSESEHTPLLGGSYSGSIDPQRVNDDHITKDQQHQTYNPSDVFSPSLAFTLMFPFLGIFLCAIDVTITSTTSATIASEFGSLDIISWLGTAYLAANATIQPLSGKLTDIFGRRAGLITSFTLFIAGSLVCGTARSKQAIIFGRVVSGIGGGGINSISSFLMTDLIPHRRRGLWQGMGTVMYAVGIGLGGVFGGIVNDRLGWRWAFLALTPLAIISEVGIFLIVPGMQIAPSSTWDKLRRIDFVGAITLVLALIVLLVGVNSQNHDTAWISLVVSLPVAAAVFFIFVLIEAQWAAEPIIPIGLLRSQTVVAACLTGFFVSSAMYTLLFYIPLFLQVRGFTTSEVGLQLLAEPLGAALGTFGTGLALRIIGGYGTVKPIVLFAFLAAPIGYSLSNLETPVWPTEIYTFLMGGGFGSVLTVALIALLGVIPKERQATATGMLYAFRSVGSTIGLAASSMLLRTRLATLQAVTSSASSRTLSDIPDSVSKTCRRATFAGSGHWAPMCEAYDDALHAVFILASVFAAISLVCGMLIRNKTLHSGEEAESPSSPVYSEEP